MKKISTELLSFTTNTVLRRLGDLKRLCLRAFDRISKACSLHLAFLKDNTITEWILFMWMTKYEGAPCRPTEIIQLLISCSIIYACICIEISWLAYCFDGKHVTFFFFIYLFILYLCLTPSSLTLRGETWNKEHFLLIFIVPICSQKCILDSPLHIYKDIPEGRAVSDSFWSITSNIPHMRFLPLEGKKKKKTSEK